MTDFTLSRRENTQRGIYEIRLAGETETAILTYELKTDPDSEDGANIMIANHTGVPKSLGGRGIGTWLLQALFFDAKRQGRKIDPVCPFVKAKGEANPNWAKWLV